jgi:parallel beta-helix repeat protein
MRTGLGTLVAAFMPGLASPARADDLPRALNRSGQAQDFQQLGGIMVSVKAQPYNAAGDGDTDDLPTIQAAIDDCQNAGGGIVFLPPGLYLLKSGSLFLANTVSVMGAGMGISILRLGDGVNQPVVMDRSGEKGDGHAFGRIRLSDFGIDGNQQGNPEGKEGIFSTAYYSLFENLAIDNCREHGLRLGTPRLQNYASQNRVTGCRISNCGGAGIFLDINGIDSSVSDNYIYKCDYGVVIRNGGIRVINNDIYNNKMAAIQVKQTSYATIIANNDINGNHRHAIHISRTTHPNTGPWSQLLVANNSILGNKLEVDNRYDAIYVETNVENGIEKVTVTGNKIFNVKAGKRYRHGINLAKNIHRSKCAANHIQDTASDSYNIDNSCSDIQIDSLGGRVLVPIAIPPSRQAVKNPYHAPVTVYISGGVVSDVAIGGVMTGLGTGSFRLFPGQFIALHYSTAPRWSWVAD